MFALNVVLQHTGDIMSITDDPDLTTPETDVGGWVPRYTLAYFGVLALTAAAWCGLAFAFYNNTVTLGGTEWNIGLVILVLGVFHFVTGIRIAGIEEIVGAYIFGFPTIKVSGGVIVAPLGVFGISRDKYHTLEVEFPAEPQNIWRGDKELCPPGKKPPIRIPFSDPHGDYPFGITNAGIREGDPLHRRSTNEVTFITRWRILDPFNLRRNIGTQEMAIDQMEDIGVSFLNEVLTKMPLSVALFNLATINIHFEIRMRQKTRHWGIEIVDCRIKTIDLSHDLNSSIQEMSENDAKAQGAILLAQGEKAKRTLEGQGTAAAAQALAKAQLDGRTDGLTRMRAELKLKSAAILAADVARDIGQSPSDKIILGIGGLAEALGAGAAIAGALKTNKKPKPDGDATP
jgi:hypothetical protein